MRNVDDNGQLLSRYICARRVNDRNVDEFLGLCKGCLADGVINQAEAEFMHDWAAAHAVSLDTWPISVVYDRVREFLADGRLDPAEQAELFSLLRECVGLPVCKAPAEDLSTSLPIDRPAPEVRVPGSIFCLTGKFVTGTRAACESEICQRGGGVTSSVGKSTSYLVIGELGSRDWMHSSHGRKIEAAVQLKVKGVGIHIISEQHLFAQMVLGL